MPFEKLEVEVPQRLTTHDFILRPIAAEDADLDFAAVMESKDFLRGWEQTGWPADDFTVAENRKDLKKLERRHNARESFTYTVLDPTESECIGCVYITAMDAPLYARPSITPVGPEAWSDYQAAVHFWVRKSRLPFGTDRVLLDELRDWFAQEWRFGQILFVTTAVFEQQVRLLEDAGLRVRFEIKFPDRPAPELAYG
jgi:hypothetical protein